MAIAATNEKFHAILALLGIDVEGVTGIVITCNIDSLVTVEITRWVDVDPDKPVPETQMFHLTPVEEEVDVGENNS